MGEGLVNGLGSLATFSIAATGTDPLMPRDVRLTSDDSIRLEVVPDPCSRAVVAVGEACTATVRGTPLRPGVAFGQLELSDNSFAGRGHDRPVPGGVWPTSRVAWDAGRTLPAAVAASVSTSLARSGVGVAGGYLHAAMHRRQTSPRDWAVNVGANLDRFPPVET